MSKNFKVLKIDHIGIAVKNIKQSARLFDELLGMGDRESLPGGKCVSTKIELPKQQTSNFLL